MGCNRKFIAFFCAVILTVCIILSACSSGAPKLDPNHPVSLIIWHYYNGPQKIAFDNAVREFNETIGYEKGIIVEAVSKNSVNQLAEEIIASIKGEFGSSDAPDIFACYGDSAYECYKMDKIIALDQYMSQKQLQEYVEPFIQEGKLNTDQLYVFPIAKSTESIFLNKTDFELFRKAVSRSPYNQIVSYDDLKTWEGIKRVGILYNRYTDDLTPDIPGDGRAFFGIDSIANFLIVGAAQLNGEIINVTDGKMQPGLNRDILRRMFDIYYGGTIEGAFTKLGSYASDDLKTGDTLAMLTATTGARYFPLEVTMADGSQHKVEPEVLPMPVMEGGSSVAISQGAGMAVLKATPEIEYASMVFLLWFTETDRNIAFSLESGYLPVKTQALSGEIIQSALSGMQVDQSTMGTVAALETGITQIQTYDLCFGSIFDGSIAYRKLLDASLIDMANEHRANIVEQIKAGADVDLLVRQAYSDHVFEQWVSALEAELEHAILS